MDRQTFLALPSLDGADAAPEIGSNFFRGVEAGFGDGIDGRVSSVELSIIEAYRMVHDVAMRCYAVAVRTRSAGRPRG